MEALAYKNVAMASNGDQIRESAAVGCRLLERYGDVWWEAQVARKVDTGIDIEFTKKFQAGLGRRSFSGANWRKTLISPKPNKNTGGCP